MKTFRRMLRSIRAVYRPAYIAINVATALLYYLLFELLIRYQNYGILFIAVPVILLYALVVTSSVMFTIGIYTIRKSLRKKTSASACSIGTAMTLFAGVIAGCGCSAPIIYGITVFGLSLAEVSVLATAITRYSSYIIGAVIAVNLLLIAYYLMKISGRRKS